MSAGDIVFMHRQSSYNKEAGVEGSNRWSKHYYMPAQSDRSAWFASCTAAAIFSSKLLMLVLPRGLRQGGCITQQLGM